MVEVVHVVRQFAPAIGGLEEAVGKLAATLNESGEFMSSVVTLDRAFRDPSVFLAAEDRITNIPVKRIAFRGSSRYPFAPSVLAAISTADIVHVHAIDFFFDFLALTRLLHRKPMVVSTHGGFFHTRYASALKKIWFQTITRASATQYRAVCASSEADFTLFSEIAASKVRLARNGVDIAKWRDKGSPMLRPAMVCLGRFSANKRIPLLFPILRELREQHLDWSLIIVGVESDLDRSAIAKLSQESGVPDAVRIIVNGSEAEIGQLLGEASFIVSASEHEGFGLSIIEGMSAGLYPILSDIAAFRSIASDTGLGLIVDPESGKKSVAEIIKLYDRLNADHPRTRLASIEASERYGWAEASEKFSEVYREIRKSARG